MKKIICILLMMAPFIFSGISSEAMPPHPDLLKKWKEEGTLEKNMKRTQSSSLRKNMNINKTPPKGSGVFKIPVILVGYTDVQFNDVSTASSYSDMLNGKNDADLSAKKYYKDMSNGKLVIEFTVFDIVTAAEGAAYYGANVNDFDQRPGTLVHDAVVDVIAATDSSFDFSQFNNDGDGKVDTVIVIHAGPGEETSGIDTDIWSHQWDLASAQHFGDGGGVVQVDGVEFNVYTIQPEYVESAGDSSIGVFCHELGHVFGLPDLYDTSYETKGVGDWSLMSSGSWGSDGSGKDPAPLLAWERYFIGENSWLSFADINPVAIINPRDHTPVLLLVISIFLMVVCAALLSRAKYLRTIAVPGSLLMLMIAVSCSVKVEPGKPVIFDGSINDIEFSHEAYVIPLAEEQFLFLEGKTAAAGSGWYVPGTGVLVTHIHQGIIRSYYSNNTVNAGSTRVHGVNVVEADGGNNLWVPLTEGDPSTADAGKDTDLFSSETNSSLTTSTTPNTKYYTGSTIDTKTGNSGVSLTSFSSRDAWPITFHAEIN